MKQKNPNWVEGRIVSIGQAVAIRQQGRQKNAKGKKLKLKKFKVELP